MSNADQPRSRRQNTARNAVNRLLSALDRLITAAKQAERARDDLIRKSKGQRSE